MSFYIPHFRPLPKIDVLVLQFPSTYCVGKWWLKERWAFNDLPGLGCIKELVHIFISLLILLIQE